ncbi:MAG: glycoside hydrolase family 3 C-terminal domain-containing protein [Clostridia bacterium]|nr:glycoside hydrolase family 3 C-terminal domain-containing protein [Clostridia bacterium]
MTFKERAKELVSKMTIGEKMSQMKYDSPAIERLGIPAYNWWNEALHGVARSGCATVFPQAIGMAASFDTELMYEVATAISDEARAKYNEYKKFGDTLIYQGLTIWSPNINIFRDPRWGRGHETYGEDPYLTGEMGVAFIKGLQGEGKYRKVDATIKHYAVHSGPESLRHGFNAEVNQKDLYETYLWAFKYCIDNANPSAVMGAYNRTNGEPCCASKTLIKDILYGEFGFDGYVVSDCGAICDINEHHKVTEAPAESAALAVNNGCNLNCGSAYNKLVAAYAIGLVSEEAITEAVERLFTARFRLGMFDDDCEYNNIPYDIIECDKHRELSRRMAQESMVLLKNDGILPLKQGQTVAVIGPNADDRDVLIGNYHGTPSEYTTLLKGIQNANEGRTLYARGCHLFKEDEGIWAEHPLREAVIAAKHADVVIMIMGLNPLMEGEEGGDASLSAYSGDKPDIELPMSQKILYEEIKKTGKPIVFVNVSGSCIALGDQDKNCNAVIQCFYPGAEGGDALADILFGKISPSGRLPVTFYKSTDDLPDFEDYSMENRTYKFFNGEVVYPFGHGLTYSDITESRIDENTVEISNNGNYEVNYTVLNFEYIPHKNLCGFKKILIKPKEKVTVSFK